MIYNKDSIKNEIPVILISNAIIYIKTMMIQPINTLVTIFTMKRFLMDM